MKLSVDTQNNDKEVDTDSKDDAEEHAETDGVDKNTETQEVENVVKSEEQDNKEQVQHENENPPPKVRPLAKRTVSLPLVQVPEEILNSNALTDKSKSQSHEGLVQQSSEEGDVNPTSSIDSDHIKIIESEPESRPLKDHSRRISMKNIKKKFKQKTKKVRINENSNRLVIDPNDANSGPMSPMSPSEKSDNGKGSETDDNTQTDDDMKSPFFPKSPNEVKSPMGLKSPAVADQDQRFEKDGGFFRRVSVKMKNFMTGHDYSDDEDEEKKSTKKYKVTVIDLTADNNNSKMVIHKMTLKDFFQSQKGRFW